jgi:hypothetical protein
MGQKRWMKTKLIECSCGFGETFLKIGMEDFDGFIKDTDVIERDWFVEIIVVSRRFRDRLRIAWDVLRGREANLGYISIDTIDIKEIRDLADQFLADYDKYFEQKHLLK